MKSLPLLVIALVATGADAATYYAAPTGSDTTGDGSIDRPWGTPVFGASMLRSDGDVLYLRAGVYDVATPTANRTAAIYPRANNCTIASYPGEMATLRGRGGVFPTGGVIGATSGYSGLTIDRLTIQGMVMFDGNGRGTQPSKIQNSDLSVGGDGWSGTNQGAVVWIESAVNVQVSNNLIHSNGKGAEAATLSNNGLFMIYVCTDCVIENNTIYNSSGTGITMKDDVQNVIIRNNWIKDNAASAIWTGNNTALPYPKSADIYQNLITNNNTANDPEHGGITFVVQTSLVNVYNNTFHRNYQADMTEWTGNVPFTWFNNLHYASRNHYLAWPYSSSPITANYIGYNEYYGGAGGWNYRGNVFSSLAAWQSGGAALLAGVDAGSDTANPGFLNASGNWSQAADYKRASYPTTGRGGSYPAVIGAYATGNEVIGYQVQAGAQMPTPKAPSAVTVQ